MSGTSLTVAPAAGRATAEDERPPYNHAMPDARWHPAPLRKPSDALLAIGIFAVAIGLAVWVVRPFDVGPVGSDSTSMVLYFGRIVSGEQLERFLGTTPKPLLSIVYGPLYYATGDWRPISWVAILVYALAIACSATLAGRVGRSPAAAVFTAVGLFASTGMLQDVALAYSVSWALLGWSLAGLAATAIPPRYALAGLALMLAGLARPETWFIGILAGFWLVGARLRAWAGSSAPPPDGAWFVLIGLLAIPIQALHDWLLARDPLYSFAIPALGTAIRAPQDPGTVPNILIRHLDSAIPLLLLVLIGLAVLIIRRSWPVVLGLLALGPGTAAFLLYLGARNTYVLDRYALPIDIAITFGAGVGFAALAVPVLERAFASWQTAAARQAGHLAVAACVALALAPTVAPLDAAFMQSLRADRQLVANFQSAAPAIDGGLEGIDGLRQMPSARDPSNVATPPTPSLLVPARVYPMAAVQFDLPLTQVARLQPGRVNRDGSYPSVGQIVVHDQLVDQPADRFRFLEASRQSIQGSMRLVPLLADPTRGVWVVRIEEAT
jgi:hypothetical protein